ncbi:unnamed protein product [Macrosiphum euphorbiae]|uniref:Uncharacterized protein n=1 Tax=Macrosiphum euphorbiae TaxID=13131 RepID=A0AAV0XD42_9HEMI|nr:unnamed protein product [Macrosiphum euphorbiae]
MVQCVGGEVWKRHINQLLETSVAVTNPCIKTLTNSVVGPKDQLPSLPGKEVVREESGVEDSLETEKQDVPKLWRSERIKKIPNRLNL